MKSKKLRRTSRQADRGYNNGDRKKGLTISAHA